MARVYLRISDCNGRESEVVSGFAIERSGVLTTFR